MLSNRPGQVLTELLVALSVVIVGVLALVQLATKSISNSGFSKRQSEATSYGSSYSNWVRGQRDSLGWDAFAAKASALPYCINNKSWSVGACNGAQIAGTVYSSEVLLTTISSDQVEATTTISWQEGGKPFYSKQTTIYGRYTQSAFGALPTPTPTPTPTPAGNIAVLSTPTTSGGSGASAIDNNLGTAWGSGQTNPWIQLTWGSPVVMSDIKLYDKSGANNDANGGILTFSDGSSPIVVSGIPTNGAVKDVPFAMKTNITWVKFQVAGGSGSNVGLSEIQVF